MLGMYTPYMPPPYTPLGTPCRPPVPLLTSAPLPAMSRYRAKTDSYITDSYRRVCYRRVSFTYPFHCWSTVEDHAVKRLSLRLYPMVVGPVAKRALPPSIQSLRKVEKRNGQFLTVLSRMCTLGGYIPRVVYLCYQPPPTCNVQKGRLFPFWSQEGLYLVLGCFLFILEQKVIHTDVHRYSPFCSNPTQGRLI